MSSTMTDYHYSMPVRKPVGGTSMALRPGNPVDRAPPGSSHSHTRTSSSNLMPSTSPQPAYSLPVSYPPQQQQQQLQQQPPPPPPPYYHQHYQQPQQPQQQTAQPPLSHPAPQQYLSHNRRTPSSATASTSSSGGGANRTSTVSISLHRTPSSRSNQSLTPTSYVALMRKQKATVWCDRSQQEDPRLAQAQKIAKAKAAREVNLNAGGFRTAAASERGPRAKIRHGGKVPVGYSPATLLVGGSGVPARLSASEVGDEESSGDEAGSLRRQGGGRGSGRSSTGSTGRLGTGSWQRPGGRLSQGGSPPRSSDVSPLSEDKETPVPQQQQQLPKRQSTGGSGSGSGSGDANNFDKISRTKTAASGSSGETRENSFGNVGEMAAPQAKVETGKTAEDLSRRGSVDERAMTMRGPRLFVANPDLSD